MNKGDIILNLQEKNIYCGFRLDKISHISEISSNAYEFYHEKSGAKLLFIENNDDNRHKIFDGELVVRQSVVRLNK